jgi:hypothetical protein
MNAGNKQTSPSKAQSETKTHIPFTFEGREDEVMKQINNIVDPVDRQEALQQYNEQLLGKGQSTEKSDESTPSQNPPPKVTTGDLLEKAWQAVEKGSKGKAGNLLDRMSDPFGAGAILGGAVGAYYSGASFNPFNPSFLQYNPRWVSHKPIPHPTAAAQKAEMIIESERLARAAKDAKNPALAVIDTKTGQASQAGQSAAHNVTANSIYSASENAAAIGKLMQEHNMTYDEARQVMTKLYGQTGPMTALGLGEKIGVGPVDAVRWYEAAKAAPEMAAAAQAAAQAAPEAGRAAGALESAFPRVAGALPTVGKVLGGAGVVGSAADVASRGLAGDKTGATISAIGSVAPFIPKVPGPIGLGIMGTSILANYLRDNPEARKKLEEGMAAPYRGDYTGLAVGIP